MATLETKLADAKASHSRLVEVATRSMVDANKERTVLQNSQARLVKVEREAKLAWEDLDKVLEQPAGSAKAAEEVLFQLSEVSNGAQGFEVEIKSLKSKMDRFAKAHNESISSAHKKSREAKMFEFCIGFLKDGSD